MYIKKDEYQRYQKYLKEKQSGQILTPDGIRLICAANNYNAEAIGKHILTVLARLE